MPICLIAIKMKAKKIILTLLACLFLHTAYAQTNGPKFDPVKFRLELVEFVVDEAGLSPAEKIVAAPIYDEFLTKKQELFKQMGKYRKFKGTNDKSYADAIEVMDRIAIEMKTLQQTYHRRLLKMLPAKKVYAMIRAEKVFNKRSFQKVTHRK